MRNQALTNQQVFYLSSNENTKLAQTSDFIKVISPPKAPVTTPASNPNLSRETIISNAVLNAAKSVVSSKISADAAAKMLLKSYTKEEIKAALNSWVKTYQGIIDLKNTPKEAESIKELMQKNRDATIAILNCIK
jgi:hypothetical protein